ncbi:MAG: MazG family protein [Baekduia sp.]
MGDRAASAAQAVGRLDQLTRELREKCPWDREQDERSIVPHTVEEAYELADAAYSGDDGKLLDELGDVLFQVHFLSLLLEERGAGSLAEVADHCRQKLVSRHPHVFGDAEADTAAEVLKTWDAIKQTEAGREPGIFGEVPENLPSLLYARKVQRRAATSGLDVEGVPYDVLAGQVEAIEQSGDRFAAIGDALFALVSVARKLKVDPELALRSSAGRFQGRVELAEQLATDAGEQWREISLDRKLAHYAAAAYQQETEPQ